MISRLFPDISYSSLSLMQLVVFFILFFGVIVWVYMPSKKEKYERLGLLPIKEDDEV